MSKQKKLSLTEINKLSSQYEEKKKIILQVDDKGEVKEYAHNIAVKFKRSDIRKLIIDYVEILRQLDSMDEVTEETITNASSLLYILIVKYFSDIPLPKIDDVESLVKVSERLLNLGIFKQLFEVGKGFDPEELKFLEAEVSEVAKQVKKNWGELMAGLLEHNLVEGSVENESSQES